MYVYNSLCFGLATAGHIFTKVVRVMVAFWRSMGHKVITFLDDGLGGDSSYERAVQSSRYVRQSIQEFGFLLAEEKCEWLPKLQITWLGYFICMDSGKFFITDDRVKRLELTCKSMLYQLGTQKLRILPARFAASVAGQIISMQSVLGKVVRLKTRELYKCIDTRLSWDSPVFISDKAEQEVSFWLLSIKALNFKGRDFKECDDFETMVFCDASSDGYGGYIDVSDYHNSVTISTVTLEGTQSMLESVKSRPAKVCSVALEAAVKAKGSTGPKAGRSDLACGLKSVTQRVRNLNTPEEVKSDLTGIQKLIAPDVAISYEAKLAKLVAPEAVTSDSLSRSGAVKSNNAAKSAVRLSSYKGSSPGTQRFADSVFSEASSSLNLSEVKSVTPEVVRTVTPEVVKAVTPEAVKTANTVVAESFAPEVVKSVTPEVVRSGKFTDQIVHTSLGNEVIGVWSCIEKKKSSTWREAETVKRVLVSNVDTLRGKRVKVFSDNKNVQSVLQAGSSKEELQEIASDVHDFCDSNQIDLSVGWIPRALNERADYLSRCKDCDDWEIADWIFNKLDQKWGKFTIDRFATNYNRKCQRFNSKWWVPGTEGVNALNQRWSKPENNWLVPPARLVLLAVRKLEAEKAQGTLLVPDWPSAPFYPVVFKSEKSSYIKEVERLPRCNIISKGLGNNGIFGENPLAFDMLALKMDCSL